MSVAKKARTGEASVKQECAPLLRFLGATDAGGGLTNVCRGMLQSMAPHALQTCKEDRHQFQDRLISEIGKLVNEEEQKHRGLVKIAEEALSTQSVEVTKVAAELADAQKGIEANVTTKEARQGELDMAAAALKAAKEAAVAVGDRKSQLLAKQKQQHDEKAEYTQAIAEAYPILKESKFVGHHSAKNKSIAHMVKLLNQTGAGETLSATISTVLRTKVAERGKFAEQALEHADAALNQHVASLDASIARSEGEIVEIEKEILAADEAVRGEEAKHEAAYTTSLSAQNAWATSSQKALDAKDVLWNAESNASDLKKTLDKTNASCDRFLELVALFQRLQERSAEQPKTERPLQSSPQAAADAEMVVDTEMNQDPAVVA